MSGKVATTQWSQVLAARDGTDTEAQAALESLCQTYWQPIYAYIRHQGSGPEEALDLTQGFFAEFLERDFLGNVDPSKGRFRSFLLASVRHFLAHERRRDRTLKRGGSIRLLSLSTDVAEEFYSGEPASLTPEEVFEGGWALTVLDQAITRLREQSEAFTDPNQFELLRPYLTSSEPQAPYNQVAHALGMNEGAVRTAVHRLRKRFGQCLRAEIAEIVSDPADVDDEVRHLLEVVNPNQARGSNT
jgi:RNA polymerase sigma-70 factor (ECF subfamily)